MSTGPVTFETVFKLELDEIQQSRQRRTPEVNIAPPTSTDPYVQADDAQLLGVAFSGGGIRSATFNLGILQALGEMDMLRWVDYLSTVSGGGYIGSWLAAWIKLKAAEIATEDEIRDFCRGRIAHFKIPQHVRFVDSFPMTVSGKIQKFRIREQEIDARGLRRAAGIETA